MLSFNASLKATKHLRVGSSLTSCCSLVANLSVDTPIWSICWSITAAPLQHRQQKNPTVVKFMLTVECRWSKLSKMFSSSVRWFEQHQSCFSLRCLRFREVVWRSELLVNHCPHCNKAHGFLSAEWIKSLMIPSLNIPHLARRQTDPRLQFIRHWAFTRTSHSFEELTHTCATTTTTTSITADTHDPPKMSSSDFGDLFPQHFSLQ